MNYISDRWAAAWVSLSLAATLVLAVALVAIPGPNAGAFPPRTDEAVVVWQHRDTPTALNGFDIWWSAMGRPNPGDPTASLGWHAAGGPVPEAAPLATAGANTGDDKNPHVGIGGSPSVTLAVWQKSHDTGAAAHEWDIYWSRFSSTNGTWTGPSPIVHTATTEDFDPNVAVDSNGNAVAVWVQRSADGTSMEIVYSTFVNASSTWSAPASLGSTGGQASLPEVTFTTVASTGGVVVHKAVAAWSDVPPGSPDNDGDGQPDHRMFYSIFNGPSWTLPAQIPDPDPQGDTLPDVGYANYIAADPDPFGAFARLGAAADAQGNAYITWGAGPEQLGESSPGVVGMILQVASDAWSPMLNPDGGRQVGTGGCENPDLALTSGGGDLILLYSFAGLIEDTFRTGGVFQFETFSYNSELDDHRPSNTGLSLTEMVGVNWGASGAEGDPSEIIWSVGTVDPGVDITWTAAAHLIPSGLPGEDMFPEFASGFAAVDANRPTCRLISRTPTELQVQVQDGRATDSGLREIAITNVQNATLNVPPFPQGTKDPVVVTATKVNAAQPARFTLVATDMAGNRSRCTSSGRFQF